MNQSSPFIHIDTDDFFSSNADPVPSCKTDLIVLTEHECLLVEKMYQGLKTVSPVTLEGISGRIDDLKRLADTITHFPSLYARQHMIHGDRSTDTLIDSLMKYRLGDNTLNLPTKAILGKGFAVAKFHTFSVMTKIARKSGFPEQDIHQLRAATIMLLFTLMVEDVYLTLLEDADIQSDIRHKIAELLIMLWEHRTDKTVVDIAPVLYSVWAERDKLAPVFGTMMGTSELFIMSLGLDEQWQQFLIHRLEEPDVTLAMEEFLFGMSHEQIGKIRQKLCIQGIPSVGRDDITDFCGDEGPIDISSDPKNFYLTYTVRRDNARSRRMFNLEGPHKTLEDHFMQFILAREEEETQYNGR
ncbi:MAG: hypothetical protein LBR47_03350 [Spirochaetaceae bacterium]|jgi:hypothetical protein|nr:hypothetical protein [Spirochaetaceae bacterium]